MVEDFNFLMVNLHYTSVFHLRRTLYSGVTSDLPDLSVLQVAEVLKKKHTITRSQFISILHNYWPISPPSGRSVKKKNIPLHYHSY